MAACGRSTDSEKNKMSAPRLDWGTNPKYMHSLLLLLICASTTNLPFVNIQTGLIIDIDIECYHDSVMSIELGSFSFVFLLFLYYRKTILDLIPLHFKLRLRLLACLVQLTKNLL